MRGQAGVGKSRLAAEIAASARASGMLVLAGAAQPYADQAAYREWRAPLRGLLGLRERSGVAAVRELDHALEHIEPGLAARAPLLASPLNLRIPETELTRRLPPELRAELLCSMVLTCLRSASRRRPLLVLLEDGHWMGEPSRGLLEHVVRNLSELSMLVVVTGRHAQGEPPPLEPTSQVKLLELGELAAASTEELAALALSTAFAEAEPPPRLVTAVAERSGGNPLFVEELVSFLRGVAATVEEAAETAGPLGQLPDTLHSVVLARVDQLGEDEKATLKVASVIGRRFPAGWVSGSAPELGGREAVTRCLGALAAAELTPTPRGAATRRAPLQARGHARRGLRSMTHARRAQIHEQVARFVERAHTDDLDQQLEALAHHYGLSRNVAKKRIYLRQAGIAAKDAYANDAALDHFRRLAPLLKPAERGEIQRHIGEIHQHTGDWEAAQRAYRAALNQPATRAERAAARCRLGHLLSLRESYDDALPLLDQARSDLGQPGSDSLGSVLEYLTVTHLGRGDLTTARETASEQLRVADAAANLAARSSAADSLGLVHWYEGDHAAAIGDWFEAALVAAAGAGDRRAIIHANNDLAGLCSGAQRPRPRDGVPKRRVRGGERDRLPLCARRRRRQRRRASSPPR